MNGDPIAGLLYLAVAAGILYALTHGLGSGAVAALTGALTGSPTATAALPRFGPAAGGGGHVLAK